MQPILNIFGVLRFYSFGLFLVLAFLSGLFMFWRKGREEHYDEFLLFDAALTASFWGFLGARIGFILLHLPQFGFNLVKWFSLFAYPGYWGMAGVLTGFLALLIFAKRHKWDQFEIADFGAIGLSLALVFLFLGMFLNGSGFGNPTQLPVGVQFPGVFDKRHPVQLYGAVLFAMVFVVILRLESRYRTFLWYRAKRRSAQSGFILSSFMMAYGAIQLALDVFRPPSIVLGRFSVDVLIHVLIILLGAVILYHRSGREFRLFGQKKRSLYEATLTTHPGGSGGTAE